MEGHGVGWGTSRDESIGFGGDENSMPFSSRGGWGLQDQGGVGFDQPWHGQNQPALPSYCFPQSAGHHFSMGSDCLGNGFSCDNISCIPNSTLNIDGLVGSSNMVPSSSNSLRPPMESMNNSFYNASALPCNSVALPTALQRILPTGNGSSMNFMSNEYSNVGDAVNQRGYTCNVSSESIQPVEDDPFGKLQIPCPLMMHPSIEESDDDLQDTNLELILRKELSNTDARIANRIVLPKRAAEANLPPFKETDSISLNMYDPVFQRQWRFNYRFWPNNRSRMYILELTGEFVRGHNLQKGDYFIVYRREASENYVVKIKKRAQQHPTYVEMKHTDRRNEVSMKTDCSNRLLLGNDEGGNSGQLRFEQRENLNPMRSSPTNVGIMHTDNRNECIMNSDCSSQLLMGNDEGGHSRQLWVEQGENLDKSCCSLITEEHGLRSSEMQVLNTWFGDISMNNFRVI